MSWIAIIALVALGAVVGGGIVAAIFISAANKALMRGLGW